MYQEPIERVKLHAFGDASRDGVGAAIYAVVTQASGISQGLVTAKSLLPKQEFTIPRLEFVAGHMTVNLAVNVLEALECFPLATDIQCWLDSTVALHWLSDHGEYRQFVANRVKKIQAHSAILNGATFLQRRIQLTLPVGVVTFLEKCCGGRDLYG